jgi:flagellar biosynthesis protein FlhF
MKVRRYEAKTYRDALAQVRDDLGPDAVILTTKELTRGGLFGLFARGAVEIVAATDVPVASPTRTAKPKTPGVVRYDRPQKPAGTEQTGPPAAEHSAKPAAQAAEPAVPLDGGKLAQIERGLAEIRETLDTVLKDRAPEQAPVVPARLEQDPWVSRLVTNGVPEACAAELIASAREAHEQSAPGGPSLDEAVEAAVRASFQVTGPMLSGGRQTTGRVVALVGPTGVGKTTTLAKLAAQYGLIENRRVALLTVDTYRVAAVEQLRAFADIMALPIEVASTAAEARAKLWALGGQELVLVDTAGRSQHSRERIDELCELMRSLEPDEIHLVVSATAKPADLLDIYAEFGRLQPNRLIVTKLDETRSYGGLLALAREAKLPISYLTHGQKVPEDMTIASLDRLVGLVLGTEDGGGA